MFFQRSMILKALAVLFGFALVVAAISFAIDEGLSASLSLLIFWFVAVFVGVAVFISSFLSLLQELRLQNEREREKRRILQEIIFATYRTFDPLLYSTTLTLGHLKRPELGELKSQVGPGKIVVLVGQAGTGKTGLLCDLVNELAMSNLVMGFSAKDLSPSLNSPESVGSNLPGSIHRHPVVTLTEVQARKHKNLFLCIDEIDQLEETELWRTLKAIIRAAQSHKIGVILAVRVEETRQGAIITDLRQEHPDLRSVILQPFSSEKAAEHLSLLGIVDPSKELLNLACNLRDYGMLAKLVEQNVDIRPDTSRIRLWDLYIKEMDVKETKGTGELKREAIKLAHAMLTTGHLDLPCEPNSQIGRLTSWGACIYHPQVDQVSFRYEELVYFLYALEAMHSYKYADTIKKEVDQRFLIRLLPIVQEAALQLHPPYGLEFISRLHLNR